MNLTRRLDCYSYVADHVTVEYMVSPYELIGCGMTSRALRYSFSYLHC